MALAHVDDEWPDDPTLGRQPVSLRGYWTGMVMLLRAWDCDWVFVLAFAVGRDGDGEVVLICGFLRY